MIAVEEVMPDAPGDITGLLQAHAAGDAGALERLLPRVYEELRRIARARLRHERAEHTLAPTEVVHEAFMGLMPLERVEWKNRLHFFAIASRAMRNVLVDHAVRRMTLKRGGGWTSVPLDDDQPSADRSLEDLVALGRALERLERLDARQVRVVECRFFGGLSLEETAEALDISVQTVSRDWTVARAWLKRELSDIGDRQE